MFVIRGFSFACQRQSSDSAGDLQQHLSYLQIIASLAFIELSSTPSCAAIVTPDAYPNLMVSPLPVLHEEQGDWGTLNSLCTKYLQDFLLRTRENDEAIRRAATLSSQFFNTATSASRLIKILLRATRPPDDLLMTLLSTTPLHSNIVRYNPEEFLRWWGSGIEQGYFRIKIGQPGPDVEQDSTEFSIGSVRQPIEVIDGAAREINRIAMIVESSTKFPAATIRSLNEMLCKSGSSDIISRQCVVASLYGLRNWFLLERTYGQYNIDEERAALLELAMRIGDNLTEMAALDGGILKIFIAKYGSSHFQHK